MRSRTFRRFWVCVFTAIFVMTGVLSNPKPTMAAPCATGNDVTIAAGCEWASGTHVYTGTLTINAGVTVTADANGGGPVTVIVDNLTLNGTITASGEGSAAGAGTGVGESAAGGGGAGHGGNGGGGNAGNLASEGGGTYGSPFAPSSNGSGGGDDTDTAGQQGGAGGGAIKIFLTNAGTLTLGNGAVISASGTNATSIDAGGGSGGSIWIDATLGTITAPADGRAVISANGGASVTAEAGGGGGGGRVAIYYTTLNNSTRLDTTAYGGQGGTQGSAQGQRGGAGTVFLKAAADPNGDLLVDNGNFTSSFGNPAVTTQSTSSTQLFDDVTIRNGAYYVIPNTFTLSATSTLTGGGTRRPSVTSAVGGALEVPSSTFTFDQIDVVHRGSIGRNDGTLTDATFTNSTYTYDSNTAEYDFTLTGTLARDSALTLNSGEGPLTSAAIDTANGFAYFVADTSPGTVIKVNLSTFTRVGALTLNAGENLPEAAAIDAANGFLYLATDTAPIRIVKIDLSTFTRVGAITLDSGEDNLLEALAIDATNGFLYVGTDVRLETYTTPAKVVKIDLSTFTRVGALTLNSGESRLGTMVIDETNGFLYVGNYQTGSQAVTKIDLSGFTRVGSVAASGQFRNSVIDVSGGYAYFGSYHSPNTSIQRIGLSGFTDAGNLTLEVGENIVTSMVIDPADGYMYAGLSDAPSKIVQVNLATFTRAKGLTFNSGENGAHSAVIDTANDVAYFGGGTSPGKIVKVSGPYSATEGGLGSLTIGSGATFSQEGNATLSLDAFSALSGSTLTHAANGSTHANSLVISASTSLTVASGTTVTVAGRGYSAANGPGAGVAGANNGGGGSYGGNGGLSSVTSPAPTIGATYGSVIGPSDLGSGGTYTSAGAGGGLVKFTSASVTLNASINANGANSSSFGGGGSGGSVWIDAGTVAGTATITATGGVKDTGTCGSGGAGAGGRIAITGWTTLSSGIAIQARGGDVGCSSAQDGGAGTVYLQASASSTGDVVVDNNNVANGANTTQVAGSDETYANITIRNAAKYVVPSGDTLALSSGGTLTGGGTVQSSLTINSGGEFDTAASTFNFNNIDVVDSGTILSVTDLTVTSAAFTLSGAGTFGSTVTSLSLSGAAFTNGSSDANINLPNVTMSNSTYNNNTSNPGLAFTTFTVPSGSTFNDNSSAYYSMGSGLTALSVSGNYVRGSANTLFLDTLSVASGGIVSHATNGTAFLYKLDVSATTSVTVSSGGAINANGRGYADEFGPGAATGASSNCQHGASYGGLGGLGSFTCTVYTLGAPYGSVSAPTDIGSGGQSGGDLGAYGGGAIKIIAPTVTVDGTISANGATGSTFDGGGSGGSVWIVAPIITTTGSGIVSANGGGTLYAFCGAGGGGGGGRVALTGWTTLSSSIARTATGHDVTCASTQDGGAGTVFTKSSAATNGDLFVTNNNPSNGAATEQVYGTSQTYDAITISAGADYVIPATTTLTLAAAGTLTGGGATQASLTVNGTGIFNPNAATFTFNDLDVAMAGIVSTVTNLSVTNAAFTASATGTFGSPVTALTLTSATFTNASADANLDLPNITMSSSTYNNNTSNPGLDFTSFTIPSGSTFNDNSSAYYSLGANLGSMSVSGTYVRGSDNTIFLDTLSVASGGVFTHLANSTTALGKQYWLDISATTSVTVSSGGSINGNSKGYSGNNGPGAGVQGSNCGGGGSYGGNGGQPGCGATVATIGNTYGSPTAPSDIGSGGTYTAGGAGGGAVKIAAPTVTVDGTVSANGANGGSFSGGGAGGSVWIDATTVTTTGSGSVTATGGSTGVCSGGGSAGGGRVAITGYVTLSGSITRTAFGGDATCATAGDGGAGTVYTKAASATNGDLRVENNNQSNVSNTTQVAGASETYDLVTVRSGSKYVVPSGSSLALPAAGDCSALVGGGTNQASLTVNGTLTLPNATCTIDDLDLVVSATTNTLTDLTMTNGTFTINTRTSLFPASSHDRLVSLTLGSGGGLTTMTTDPFFVDVLTANSGSSMSHIANTTTAAASNTLYVSATTSITVNTGVTVDLTGLGYEKSEGPGAGSDSTAGNGGAHGGNGGSSTALGTNTATYGNYEFPSDSGSGGGDDINTPTAGESEGGGSIHLSTPVTGSITVASDILVDGAIGNAANDDGGGAGGSIWIQGGAVTLSADLSVDGGAGDSANAGCGGGGRIAVHYNTLDYSSGTATAATGCATARAGTTGSVYFAQFGELPVPPTNTGTVISPAVLEVGQNVVISATATDDVGITKIEIYLDGTDPGNLVKTCLFSPAETPALCQYEAGSITAGSHSVTVISYDSLDQTDTDTVNFTVAGRTSDNTVSLSRTKVSEIASVGLSFELDGESTGTLTLTLPAGFTVLSAPTSGSGCLSGFGFTSTTMYAAKTGCTGAVTMTGGTVQNPAVAGAYTVTWTNDNGSAQVFIVDDDNFNISASVDPVITFNVGSQTAACDGSFAGNGGALGLGALTVSAVATSDVSSVPHICMRLSTNAPGGAVVTVRSQNAALASVASPGDTIPSGTATLAAGTAGYGICVGSAVGDSDRDVTTPVGAFPAAAGPFGGSCSTSSHDVGGLTTDPQILWQVSDPTQNAFFRAYVKASIDTTTAPHNDYTDVLTFIATATY